MSYSGYRVHPGGIVELINGRISIFTTGFGKQFPNAREAFDYLQMQQVRASRFNQRKNNETQRNTRPNKTGH
jgi:hypothetical protein